MSKADKIKTYFKKQQVLDVITVAMMVIGLLALFTLVFFYIRPLKLAEIKVPIATGKASYFPEQQVSGIFFGETFYTGDIKVLREVFCKNYKGVIKPPVGAADGDYYLTQSKPTKLEGRTVEIGYLPASVPIGANCVIQFTNIYTIDTPFGVRHEEVVYYTQNFSIIDKQERESRDAEDAKQNATQQSQLQQSTDGANQSEGGGTDTNINIQNEIKQPPSENSTPSEPIQVPKKCTVNLLGVKLFCD